MSLPTRKCGFRLKTPFIRLSRHQAPPFIPSQTPPRVHWSTPKQGFRNPAICKPTPAIVPMPIFTCIPSTTSGLYGVYSAISSPSTLHIMTPSSSDWPLFRVFPTDNARRPQPHITTPASSDMPLPGCTTLDTHNVNVCALALRVVSILTLLNIQLPRHVRSTQNIEVYPPLRTVSNLQRARPPSSIAALATSRSES